MKDLDWLIRALQEIRAERGNLPVVYEMYGEVSPFVIEVDGRTVVDLAAD